MKESELLPTTYKQMLRHLCSWLGKAETELPLRSAKTILSERLAPDMLPLASQVFFACYQAQESGFLLAGTPTPASIKALATAGRENPDTLGDIAQAQSQIKKTIESLGEIHNTSVPGNPTRTITLDLGADLVFELNASQFIRDWALPQFFFHINTAYSILRHRGVKLGKADYVPHMFVYQRQG